MSTKHTIENATGKTFLEVSLLSENNILKCRWIGFVNEIEPSKKACLLIISLIEKYSVKLIFNDNREQTGPWPPINDWLFDVWFPGMKEAGLEKFAHIHSENIFTEISAKSVLQEDILGITFKHFDTPQTATDWLVEAVVSQESRR